MRFGKSGRLLVYSVFALSMAAGSAFAGDGSDAPVAAQEAQAAAAEVKMAKSIENREPVEEGTSFAAGEKIWAWSRITGANGTTVKHVWKKDGAEVWSATLEIKSNRWTTYSRRKVSAGQYEVEVRGEDGTSLGTVSFTVQ